MHLLQALDRFYQRPVESRADVLDIEATLYGRDCWPEFATACVLLSGYLGDEALTDAELDEALAHFQTLHSAGVVSDDDWRQAANEVITAKIADLEEQGVFADAP